MENENIKQLTAISYPNTVSSPERENFTIENGYSFKGIMKAGEMAGIQWIQVYRGEVLAAEIKESVCNLFYN